MAVYAAGPQIQVAAEFTRPANTTAYASGDVVSNSASATVLMTFANAASRPGGGGIIRKAQLFTDQSTWTAEVKVHLFNILAPTAAADNAALANEWDDRDNYLGFLDFGAAATEGAGSEYAYAQLLPDFPFVCAAGDASIYGLIEVEGTPTPASGQKFYVALTIDQE